ncbi:MAG: RDD family protein [Calditrichia bacterium]
METIHIQTSQNVTITFELAGIGDRIAASLIDLAIIIGYVLFASTIVGGVGLGSWGIWTLIMLPIFFYDLVLEIAMEGQTIGKRARRIRVANVDGSAPTFTAYLLRWIIRPVEVVMALGVVAMTTILLNNRGQRLGDIAANTTVIKVGKRLSLEDTLYTNIEENYVPVYRQAADLEAKEVEMIKDVLRARLYASDRKTFDKIARKARLAIEARLKIIHTESTTTQLDVPFLEAILKDYNAITSGLV